MKLRVSAIAPLVLIAASCGGSTSTEDAPVDEPTSDAGADAATLDDAGDAAATDDVAQPTAVADPTLPGPYDVVEFDSITTVKATNHNVPMHVAYPSAGPTAGPYPVVVFAHGFQLASSLYYSYVKHLASFGYVAIAADYPAPFFPANHALPAKDLSGVLDWALSAVGTPVNGRADPNLAGVSGHSLGGKLAILAASDDARFKATITFDPVNSSVLCNATDCPDAKARLPFAIPTAFVGETTDEVAGFGGQACAPKTDNFLAFYANAVAPSFAVTVVGANHMSFLDDPNCGITCSVCQPAKADHGEVLDLAHGYLVAFYERYLRGNVGYDDYLTGAAAQIRWVQSGLATIDVR